LKQVVVALGFLAVGGCGLELGGAAITSSDAQATDDGTTVSGETGQLREGGSEARVASDGSGGEVAVSDSTNVSADAGGEADATASPDAVAAGDSMTSPSDAAADTMSDAVSTSACVNAIPSGWSLVVYDLGADPCPANFTSHEVSGAPTIQPGACSCGCSVSQPGNCAQGTLRVHPSVGGNGSCDVDGGWSKDLDGSACTVLGVTLYVQGPHSDLAYPLAPQGGTCSDTTQADTTKVATAAARYCDVPSAGADSVCNGTVPSGFAACIMTDGETSCPSGTPFSHAYVVEDGAMLQCSSCTGCTVATTCSNATLAGFSDMACSGPSLIGSVGVDGGCNAVNLTTYPASLVAIEYAVTVSSSCNPGSSAPSAPLTNPRTICCR
jgi:hypothetical protein